MWNKIKQNIFFQKSFHSLFNVNNKNIRNFQTFTYENQNLHFVLKCLINTLLTGHELTRVFVAKRC